jgi:hypothetical protein
MKAKDLKRIIKEELLAILAENAPAKEKEKTKTKPGNPGISVPNPSKSPIPKTNPKAVGKNEVKEDKAATLVKGIMNKYKKLKK